MHSQSWGKNQLPHPGPALIVETVSTLTGSGGGGTHVCPWEEPIAFTNRERERLQTFSDDFIFYGGKESVRNQIGMAVPPKGAKIILEAVPKTSADIEYPHVCSMWKDSDFLAGQGIVRMFLF